VVGEQDEEVGQVTLTAGDFGNAIRAILGGFKLIYSLVPHDMSLCTGWVSYGDASVESVR